MEQHNYHPKKISPWLILGLILLGLWWISDRGERPKYDKEAAPRVVVARGGLYYQYRGEALTFQPQCL
jgi:hypothetical protein